MNRNQTIIEVFNFKKDRIALFQYLVPKSVFLVFIFIFTFSLFLHGQDTLVNPLEKGLVHNFTADGKYFIKFSTTLEFWTRVLQYNPGTKSPSGDDIKNDFDIVLRRLTAPLIIKLDRFVGLAMLGTGTQTYSASISPYTTSKPSLYFYEIWGSYEFVKEKLRLGYGLSLYKGLSRYSSATASRTLGADVPMLSAPDVLTTEQTARHLGIFAAGNIGILNYRMILGKPFLVNSANRPAFGLNKAADVPNSHYTAQGYFALQFLEKEVNFLPFFSGTYVGKKKIFNIGGGFSSHPKATQSVNESQDTVTHNEFHYAIDLFLEYPFKSGACLTLYSAFFNYNYGPNYLMNGGVGNVLITTASPNSGISEPNYGTGKAFASQVAWLFPKVFGKSGRLQVYYEGNYMFFDALNDAAMHHNIGATYYILGHNLKFTGQYELRPYFPNKDFDSYKSLFVLKTQVSF
jgi:hypothetical protein